MVGSAPTLAELLAHENFLRRLARSLLRDREGAEDLVQETWVRAMAGGPRSRQGIRSWLTRVLRSLARDRLSNESRRRGRERAAVRPEATPSASSLLEMEQSRRDLAEALLQLDDKQRKVLLLRYYEDLPPRAIAAHLGLAPGLVRSRLHRGLAELRASLRRRGHGNLRSLRALAGMPAWSPQLALAVFGGVWMKKLMVSVTAVLFVALGIALWSSMGSETEQGTGTDGAAAQQVARTGRADPTVSAPQRMELEEEPVAVDFHGRVRYADGSPAAGLAYTIVPDDFRPRLTWYALAGWVVFEEGGPVTGEEGEFTIHTRDPERGYLWVRQGETHYAAFDLRGHPRGTELYLTEEGVIELRWFGLGPDQEFDAHLYPYCLDVTRGGTMEGPPILQPRNPGPSGPALEMALPLNLVGRGPGTHRFAAVPGFPYLGCVLSDAFEDPPLLELRSGQTGDFLFDRPVPFLEVELLEVDGMPTGMGGRWLLYNGETFVPSGELEAGVARVDWNEGQKGEEKRFFVLMEDGEWLEEDLRGRSPDSDSRVRIRRGTGEPGVFIPCSDLERYIDLDYGERTFWGQVLCLFDERLPMAQFARLSSFAGPIADTRHPRRYYVPTGVGIGLHDLPDTWIRLYLVCEDGRVAEVTPGTLAQGFRWLPMEDLPDLDLTPFLEEHRDGEFFDVSLYYGLHPSLIAQRAWGTLAGDWNRQPRHDHDPYGREIVSRQLLPDVLTGLRAPAGVPAWFLVYSSRGLTFQPAR